MYIDYPGFQLLRLNLNSRVSILISGLVFFIIALAFASVYFHKYQIICPFKDPKQCVLKVRYFGLYNSITPLNQLYEAKVSSYVSPARRGKGLISLKIPAYQVVLHTSNKDILLYWKTSSEKAASKTAKAINNYLRERPAASFSIPYFYSFIDVVIFIIVLAFLYLTIRHLCEPILMLTIDKNKELIALKWGNIIKLMEKNFNLADIKELIIQEKRINLIWTYLSQDLENEIPKAAFKHQGPLNKDSFKLIEKNRKRGQRFKFCYTLVFKDGSILRITPYFKANFNELRKIVMEINAFIY